MKGISIVFEGGTVRLVDGKEARTASKRPGRGNSVLSVLPDYVSIDIETTGLSPEYDEIIEIAALRVRGGEVVDRFSSLVKPSNMDAVDEYITELTGISPAMLEEAPEIEHVLPDALAFIGADVLVGHRVSFDVNFIYDACQVCGLPVFSNDYIDTMRLSRRLYPGFVNYKLKTLVKQFNIPQPIAHRAEADAETAVACYQYMVQTILRDGLEDVLRQSYGKKYLHAADIVGNPEAVKENSPLYGMVVVFTGTLERMVRKDAMQLVADLGGVNADSVTKKTNFLVLGNNDYCKTIKDGKSTKQKKAEKLILSGADLQIIPENVFYEMLEQ